MEDYVLGIQFHLEMTPEIIRELLAEEAWELQAAPFPYVDTADQILQNLDFTLRCRQSFYRVLDSFFGP